MQYRGKGGERQGRGALLPAGSHAGVRGSQRGAAGRGRGRGRGRGSVPGPQGALHRGAESH